MLYFCVCSSKLRTPAQTGNNRCEDIREVRSKPGVEEHKAFSNNEKECKDGTPDYEPPISLASCSALVLTSSIVPTM